MKKCIVLLLMAGFFCFAGIAAALEFSADTVMTAKGRTSTSKMYIKDKKVRMEMPGQQSYSIMRGDKNVVWMVIPSQKMYMEMKPDPSNKPKVDEKIRGEVSRKLIGSETIGGHPTQKYEVTTKIDGRTEKMYQWMATDIKLPIKSASVNGDWTMEYKNIKMSGQSDNLFEVPVGYSKKTMPGMPSGMPKGMKIPRTSQE
jgi:hypothetical protein